MGADGAKTVKARMAAKDYQDPDLKEGNLDIAGCVSGQPSHSMVISFGAPKKRRRRSLDMEETSLQADCFSRDGFPRFPPKRNSENTYRPLRKYLFNSADLPVKVGLRFEVSPYDPCLYFVFGKTGGAVGAFTTHTLAIFWLSVGPILRPTRGIF